MSGPAAVVRSAHASGMHGVSRSLEALHAEMLRSAADDAGAVRLSVLNVVAACITDSDARDAAQVLSAIGARHPARAIVVHAKPDELEPALDADVSLQRTTVSDHEVYTELILLSVSGEPAFHLSSVVGPLLVPDIPTDLWVVGAPRLVQAFNQDAIELCDRIILDTGAYPNPAEPLRIIAAELRRSGEALSVADLAWERIRPWRDSIAQAVDVPSSTEWLRGLDDIEIQCEGADASAEAALLAGWLRSRLRSLGTEVPLRLKLSAGTGGLRAVTLRLQRRGTQASVTVTTRREALCVTTDLGGTALSLTVPCESPDLVSLISRLMDDTRRDQVYADAVTDAASSLR